MFLPILYGFWTGGKLLFKRQGEKCNQNKVGMLENYDYEIKRSENQERQQQNSITCNIFIKWIKIAKQAEHEKGTKELVVDLSFCLYSLTKFMKD